MASNHNSPGADDSYDPAGSTQMFRAFVEEAAPARPEAGTPGSRRKQPEGNKAGARVAVAIALAAMFGIAIWMVVLR
ncbi:hypothetical protein ABZ924_03735 [Streptomyces sp. NPDC046876]|uniref:hypothetical protein n=1 Tax=Streptomyces sp. NPDC046876 TaxID=3155616 RepID=UPI0033F10C38